MNESIEGFDLSTSDLDSSVVLISDEDVTPLVTPTKVTPASKRKRDVLLEMDEPERSSSGDLESFLDMERASPELRRKSRGTTPVTPSDPAKKHNVPDVVSESDFDSNLPETVTLLRGANGAKIYVVGTAHFSEESQNDVSVIMKAVKPHCLVVELCSARTDILFYDEETILAAAKDINFQKIVRVMRKDGAVQGLLYVTLLTMSAYATRQLGMAPGGEFRRAYREATEIQGCHLLLGDRAISVTVARALAALSWWQFIKLAWNLILKKEPIKKEDVERCKQKDFLEAMLSELAGEFPSLTETLVHERDKYLTFSLQNAANATIWSTPGPARVVGVVGMGHVPGITRHFGTVTDEEAQRLMVVPAPSVASRVFRLAVRGCFFGGIAYGAYKLIPYERILELARR